MAARKPAKKASKTARAATARAATAVKSASAQRVADVLKPLCAGLRNASQALALLRDAQTDPALKQALSAEIAALESNRLLTETELAKGVGEGKQGGTK